MPSYDGDVQLTVDLTPGNVTETAKELNKEIESIFNKTDTKGLTLQTKSLLATLDALNNRSHKLQERLAELQISTVPTAEYKQLETEIESVDAAWGRALERVAEYKVEVEDLKGKLQVPTEEYKRLQGEVFKLTHQLNVAKFSQDSFINGGGDLKSDVYQGIVNDIERLSEQLSTANNRVAELEESGRAFKTDAGVQGKLEGLTALLEEQQEKAENLHQAWTDLYNQMEDMVDAGTAFSTSDNRSQIQATAQDIAMVNNRIELTRQRLAALGEVDVRSGPVTLFDNIKNAALQATAAIGHLGKKAAIGALNKLRDAAKSAVKSLKEMASSGIRNGIKKLGTALTGIGKQTKSNDKLLKNSLKTLIKYGFGVRSFFFLFRKIRKAIIEGFAELAKVNEPFNKAMSELITALNYLKLSFTAAFAPVIETVAPILTKFLNLTAEAVSNVGQLMAALTGKQFTKAVPVQKNYAEEAGNAADNTKKAAEATKKQNQEAKKLQRTLAGFDDVEILHENKDTSTEKEETPQTPAFTTAPITKEIGDFAKKLMDAWKNADFTDIGRIVGEKLKAALEKIPWDKIKAVLRKIGKSIATFLNGFLETPGLFTVIGKTIAEALNSAFELVNAFVTNFHWDSLGKAIKDGILGAVDNIDWPLIEETLSALGTGIGTTLNTAFNNPEIWQGIFGTLAHALNALVLLILNFLKAIQWGELGTNFAKGLNTMIETIDWANLGELFSTAMLALLNFLTNAAQEFDWEGLGEDIRTFLSEIEWGDIVSKLVEFVLSLLIGLGKLLWGIVGPEFEKFGASAIPFLLQLGITLIQGGLYSGIIFILKTVWNWIKHNIFDPIFNGIKNAFGIKGDNSEQTRTQGKSIAKGILQGIVDVWNQIFKWVKQNVFEPLIKSVKAAFGIIGDIATGLKSAGRAIVEGIKKGITDVWDRITGFFSGHKSDINDEFDEDDFEGIGDSIISGIYNGINDGWNWLTNTVSNLANDVYNSACDALGINSPSKAFRFIGTMVNEGFTTGLEDTADKVSSAMVNITDTLTEEAEKAHPVISVDTLLQDLNNLSSSLSGIIPPVVQGKIIPYSASANKTDSTESTLSRLIDLLEMSNNLTREDMEEVMEDVMRRFPVNLYIGDEQIARHANEGNRKLGRRYSVT